MLSRVLAILLVLLGAARAEDELEARARNHYEAGRTHYRLGNFRESLREFTAGYELTHKPRFLINIAQAFRKLGDDASARKMLERYLSESRGDDPVRKQAQQQLDELGPARDPIITEPKNEPPAASPAPVVAPAAAVTVTEPAPPPKKSKLRHLGWIIPLSAAVIAGVAVGIYFGVNDPCRGSTIGCVSP
jgi:hypothetical protein